LEVIAHHTYGTSKVQTGCIAGIQKLANTEKRVREKGTIFQEGVDDDRSIYIIVEGTVDIFYEKDRHKILRLEQGDCFGESCLLYLDQETPYTRNYSAVAAKDSLLLMLNRTAIEELKANCPEAFQKLKPLAQRRQERIHDEAVEVLKEQGVALTSTSSPGGFTDQDTAIITRVVHQTVDKAIKTVHADFMEEMAAEMNELDRLKDLEDSIGQMSERLGSLEALMQKLVHK
jgi:CRP-like cAMP-binding protein